MWTPSGRDSLGSAMLAEACVTGSCSDSTSARSCHVVACNVKFMGSGDHLGSVWACTFQLALVVETCSPSGCSQADEKTGSMWASASSVGMGT